MLLFVVVFGARFLFAARAACVFLLFEVNFVLVFIEDSILKVGERLVGYDFKFKAIFHSPTRIFRNQSFFQISIDEWVNVHYELRYFQRVEKIVDFIFQHVGEEKRWLHFALSVA